jgi:hypothetical protein
MSIFSALGHGFYSGRFRKLPMLFGISDVFRTFYIDTNLAAGTTTVTLLTVPANTLYVITSATINFLSTATPTAQIFIDDAAGRIYVHSVALPGNNRYTTVQTAVPLKAGEVVKGEIQTAALHDDVTFTLAGYTIDLEV